MKNRNLFLICVITVVVISFIKITQAQQEASRDLAIESLSPSEAHTLLIAHPENTFLIDCRSMPEFEFVGHPPMAHNIPFKMWAPDGFKENTNFIDDVAEKFNKSDTLFTMCRSGERSMEAQQALQEAGFMSVRYIEGGFEGVKDDDTDSSTYGQRAVINGWQQEGLPWTLELKKTFAYKLHTSCSCD